MNQPKNNPAYRIKENSWIALIAAKKMNAEKIVIVIGKTIHLCGTTESEFLKDERWLRHELCHIAQFQRYGLPGFIIRYLWESIKKGYDQNKYEIEARKAEIAEEKTHRMRK